MIRGCNKSIVFLKDTGSEYFDEAYFIVKPNATPPADIISEAAKIVDGMYSYKEKKRGRKLSSLILFFTGLTVGFLVMLAVHLILL